MNATALDEAKICDKMTLTTKRNSVTGPTKTPVTQLLRDWRSGDEKALEALLPHVYKELHTVAAAYMRRERPGHTLHPTELIHETYLRLIGSELPEIENRKHFYALAARLMRQVLVDHARRHRAGNRGSGKENIPIDEAVIYSHQRAAEFVALDDALEALAAFDARKARVVELRFFAGLTSEEIADVVNMSPASVARDLRFAEAWLQRELRSPE
jgi:RNA polymerase sigma factor (TIGR02999 family)